NVEHEIASGFEPPRHAGRLDPGPAARFPEEEMAVWIEDRRFDVEIHAGEARAGIPLLAPRRPGAIDQQVRMMNGDCATRPHLHSADKTGCSRRGRDDEIPEHVRTVGGDGKRL